jgi:tripeptide aminopeptidase
MIDTEKLLERFCRYVAFDTASDRHAEATPSTEGQRELAAALAKELRGFGARSVEVDEHAFVIARFDAVLPRGAAAAPPIIGLMAHMDTSSDAPGKGVMPLVHRSYDGAVIRLKDGLVLDPAEFPALAAHAGDTLITSDGTTLLGADDKAGISAIMSALDHLLSHPELPRCPLEVIFTPDEETGLGMKRFPLARVTCTACYTVDGDEEGTVEAECFEAYKVKVTFGGRSIHLGYARGKLVNAVEMAGSFLSMIPRWESPQATDGRFGYYCPLEIAGSLEDARLDVYLRDFEEPECRRRIAALEAMAEAVRRAFPGGRVSVEAEKQYANMKPRLDEHPEVLGMLRRAIELSGLTPREKPIRGGTDGARLTELGIPTPNLFTGGYNYHSRLEWASLAGMAKAAETIVRLAGLWAGVEGQGRPTKKRTV